MTQYIDKDALVAEIKRIMAEEMSFFKDCCKDELENTSSPVVYTRMEMLLSFLDTLEVKDANEALRTEYEKGRADVIADTLSWLENCWPKYCSNQTIIEGFKEAIKGE